MFGIGTAGAGGTKLALALSPLGGGGGGAGPCVGIRFPVVSSFGAKGIAAVLLAFGAGPTYSFE